jgi:hypothetical protein
VRIDERVREAHLNHYCPGGLGVPVTSSTPVGLGSADSGAGEQDGALSDNELQATGEQCARCGRLITPNQDARRQLSGDLVHATCPRTLADRANSADR